MLRQGRAVLWSNTLNQIPPDTVEKASSLVRKADGQPTVTERLEFLDQAKEYIALMKEPSEKRAFDFQRCDPQHGHPPYFIMVSISLSDEGVREEVKRAMSLGQEVVIPPTAYMVARVWYYALFARRGSKHREEWRRPLGYVFTEHGGECLGRCPEGVVEVPPRFEMNLNTLNLLMNIRHHAKKVEEGGGVFDTHRPLKVCAREVPRSRQSTKRKRDDGDDGEEEGMADQEGGGGGGSP